MTDQKIIESLGKFNYRSWQSIQKYLKTDGVWNNYAVNGNKMCFSVGSIDKEDLYESIIKDINSINVISPAVCIKQYALNQVFFELYTGTNGDLGNCAVDLVNVSNLINDISRKPGVTWCNLLYYVGDMTDDVYSWIITFTYA